MRGSIVYIDTLKTKSAVQIQNLGEMKQLKAEWLEGTLTEIVT